MQVFGPNLLLNPSFEEVDEKGMPKHWQESKKGTCIFEMSNDAYYGRRSVKFNSLAPKSLCVLTQEVDFKFATPGQKALISGWSKLGKVDVNAFAFSTQYSVFWEGWVNTKGKQKNLAYTFGAEFGSKEQGWQYSSCIHHS
jgi:hypothetical protein